MGYPASSGASVLDTAIALLGSDPVTQAPIDAILVELAAVDAVIADSGTTTATSGALKKVDTDVEFYSPKDSAASATVTITAMARGHMLIRRLAQRLGGECLIAADYFTLGLDAGCISVVSCPPEGWCC